MEIIWDLRKECAHEDTYEAADEMLCSGVGGYDHRLISIPSRTSVLRCLMILANVDNDKLTTPLNLDKSVQSSGRW